MWNRPCLSHAVFLNKHQNTDQRTGGTVHNRSQKLKSRDWQ